MKSFNQKNHGSDSNIQLKAIKNSISLVLFHLKMRQAITLHSISIAIATLIVLSLWSCLDTLDNDKQNGFLVVVLIGTLTSAGAYKLTIQGIIYLAKKSEYIKKKLLGASYLNGTWIGFYIGISGKVRYFVEKFDQELDSLVMQGISFDEDLKYHSSWETNTINVDSLRRKISYMYDCYAVSGAASHNGVATFFYATGNHKVAPTKLIGFSADIHIGKRAKAMEIKISDKTNCDFKSYLYKAKEFYEENKDIF